MTTAKQPQQVSTKASNPAQVDVYMKQLQHPMKPVMEALRSIILAAGKEVGEEIYWNAPCFFYTGKMKPFAPKEYKRFIIASNFYKKDCIRLIFLTGAKLEDSSGLLTGEYADGRRLALFYSLEEVKAHEKNLQKLVKKWIKMLDK